jgi:hypothetical protein
MGPPSPFCLVVVQAKDMASFNQDLDTSLALFAHFVRCYKDDRCVDPLQPLVKCRPGIPGEPHAGATTLDDGSRWVLGHCDIHT